ncbi:MAG: von Willebrand factor type A domain-containing protein [Gammaproteobacteria bacterium]
MSMRNPSRISAISIAALVPLALPVLIGGCSGRHDSIPDPAPTVDARRTGEDRPPESASDRGGRPAANAQTSADSKPRDAAASGAMRRLEETVVSAHKTIRADAAAMAPLAVAAESGRVCCPRDFRWPAEPPDRENYAHLDDNPVRLASEHPTSTFSIDVDTGSYANVRRFLTAGSLPAQDAVRVEELINYFSYAYPVPGQIETPFAVSTEVATAPWDDGKLLLQIGIKGYEVPAVERKPANLVFLVDVSGSMSSPDKLPLLKNALKMLTRQMTARDRVSMVVYAGASGVVLEPTAGNEHARISRALDRLSSGGSTNGAGGIRLAYDMAEQGRIIGGINRVMLATDGDFNVGTVDFDALIDIVERERNSGTSLTTLGFGTGNYNDRLMEQLADAGNGNHAYIDTLHEARKVLVDQLGSTLQTIAQDVKIQVEFNPGVVAEYRLIGYENRMLRREDFNNDRIDAGEIGAGHTVTALYELSLVGGAARLIDPLRYGEGRRGAPPPVGDERHDEIAFVRLRYKAPGGGPSRLLEQPVMRADIRPADEAGTELKFAAAVAAFGQLLKGGDYLGNYDFDDVVALANAARGDDAYGYRSEFVGLARLARSLSVTGPGS